MKLTIRKAGKYYQIGYYKEGAFFVVEEIGDINEFLRLIRLGKKIKKGGK